MKTTETINWGPWTVYRQRGTHLSSERWFVERRAGRFAECLENERGRAKKFRSEAAAIAACDKANTLTAR